MKEVHSSRHFLKNYVTKKFKKPRDKKDCWGMLKLNIEPSLNEQGNYCTHTHAHIYKHMQICIYTCKHIIPYTHVHTIHIHMYTYMFSYMYVYIKCYIELCLLNLEVNTCESKGHTKVKVTLKNPLNYE